MSLKPRSILSERTGEYHLLRMHFSGQKQKDHNKELSAPIAILKMKNTQRTYIYIYIYYPLSYYKSDTYKSLINHDFENFQVFNIPLFACQIMPFQHLEFCF